MTKSGGVVYAQEVVLEDVKMMPLHLTWRSFQKAPAHFYLFTFLPLKKRLHRIERIVGHPVLFAIGRHGQTDAMQLGVALNEGA